MLSYGLTSTAKYNKKYHIVFLKGVESPTKYTLCGRYLYNENGEDYETFKTFDKPPTCPKCIKIYFNKENENTRSRQTAHIEEQYDISNAFCSLFNDTIGVAQHRSDIHRPNILGGSHPFIPYSSVAAYLIFRDLKRQCPHLMEIRSNTPFPKKFLDAGCGIGNILLIANRVGLANTYHGLEYFDNVKREAEHFLGLDMKNQDHYCNITVEKADIATYKHYGKYDFIYYYCPFANSRKEMEFELCVEDQMKVGAILIPMLKNSSAILKDKRFKAIQTPFLYDRKDIWEKISK
jgi:hypothetical protein